MLTTVHALCNNKGPTTFARHRVEHKIKGQGIYAYVTLAQVWLLLQSQCGAGVHSGCAVAARVQLGRKQCRCQADACPHMQGCVPGAAPCACELRQHSALLVRVLPARRGGPLLVRV